MAQVEQEILHWDLWKRDKPTSLAVPKIDRAKLAHAGRPVLGYSLLALAVLLPMLAPGYILTLDMAFTPELRLPEQISSSYLFHALLHYLNLLIPSDVIQKVMLLSALVLSGLGMHYLVLHIQKSKDGVREFVLWGAYIAGALYMINPFTYSRFMAGQYAVLLGYALLPLFVNSLLHFFAVPTLKRALVASTLLIIIGIVSVHTLGLAAIVTIMTLVIFAWRWRKNRRITLATIAFGMAGLIVFVAASGYWLFPMLDGSSNQGQAVAQFSSYDRQAFETTGGTTLGKLGYVLQLQGFWAEEEGLYLLPQEQLAGWAIVVLGLWALVGVGAGYAWRRHRALAVLFTSSAILAAVVAVSGTSNGGALAGFREPQKFVGLLALVYAMFAGLGTAAILAWARRKGTKAFSLFAISILMLPLLLTPTMFWGLSGQLSAREYPTDWYAMNNLLNRDATEFRVLSLPWHLYMHYPFAGRVIVNPSDKFFDKQTITSNDLEFDGASPTFPDADKKLLSEQILPGAATNQQFGEELDELGIKYILLAKTYDYKDYTYLDTHPDLQLVAETPNLKLYRNRSYGQ